MITIFTLEQKDEMAAFIEANPEHHVLFDFKTYEIRTGDDMPSIVNGETTRLLFKAKRQELVDNIVVTVNGNTFDGDEASQTRMGNAIAAAQKLNSTTIPFWVLADNTVVQDLPVSELEMARALAVVEMGNLWLPQT